MKKSIQSMLAVGLLTATLAGCVHVADHGDDVAEVERNAITAENTCGGKDRVESVDEDGFTCKD